MKAEIEEILRNLDAEPNWNTVDVPQSLVVDSTILKEFMRRMHTEEGLYFDMLSCVTGIDNGPEKGTMEVLYSLASIPYGHELTVKTMLDRDNPVAPTVSDIWKTADWLERETYDLLGIEFEGHPDLRRILLPADWEGYPLRKDYKEQEYYHGIRVAY